MTASDRLRSAAVLLRERAEAATPGPWPVGNRRHGENPCAVMVEYRRNFTAVGHLGTEANAQFASTMSPPVALAIADWLERLASDIDYYHHVADTFNRHPDNPYPRHVPEATATADAILGGAS